MSAQRAWIRWQASADIAQRRRCRWVMVVMSLLGCVVIVAAAVRPGAPPAAVPPAGMVLELAPLVAAPLGEARQDSPPPAPKPLSAADIEPLPMPVPEAPVLAQIELPVETPRPADQSPEPPPVEDQQAQPDQAASSQEAAVMGDIAAHAEGATAPREGATSLQQSAAAATFQQLLLGHLQQHKRYPLAARLRRQEGTPLVRFTMNRQGKVLQARLERGSGFQLLDAEALALLERAQPLPALPDSLPDAQLEVVVPIEFFLGAG